MFNLVLFGPPGAGKGTQAERLIGKYGFRHISTGEIIRREISEGTVLGRAVKDYIEHGHLAPDGLVIDIIAEYVASHKDENIKGYIFDGFPRTTVQAEEFEKIMAEHGTPVSLMLSLDVEDEELINRLLNRGKSSGRADDSDESVIKNRIKVYKGQTEVVADFYKKRGKYKSVDGHGSMDDVFNRICNEIDSIR